MRPPLNGAPRLDLVPGTVALLVVAIGTTGFDGFSNGGAGLPTWAALNSDVSSFVVWVAGTVTILLGCLFVLATVKGLELLQQRTASLPPPASADPRDAERVPAYG